MGKFISTKVFDGFSTCFRQWRAEGTHCRFVHGYGTSVKMWFEGDLDERNWVWDFGGMKRANGTIDGMSPDKWFKFMLDHTLIVAEDDPYAKAFAQMHEAGVAQVRFIPHVGAERFAEYIYNKVNPFIQEETDGRVRIVKVEFREHEKNTAFYVPEEN